MKQGGGAGSGLDQPLHIVVYMMIILIISTFLWLFARHWVVAPLFWLHVQEINFFQFIIAQWAELAQLVPWLHLPVPNMQLISAAKTYMLTTPPESMDLVPFLNLNSLVGNWVRYPVMLGLVTIAGYVYFFHTDGRFQTNYTMQKLKSMESHNWPQITPVINLDLLKEDLEKGPWAMAKTPLNFCKENHLLTVGEEEGQTVWKLVNGSAYRVLALQMGPLWHGVETLPIHIKALAVIFIARATRERKVANDLLKQLGASAGSGKLDFSGVELQMSKYAESKPIKWLGMRHAYVTTLMASLLEIARSDGVLATAEFLWLKPVDRRLWYMLNCVGRTTAFVEIAGPYSHWLVEKKLGKGFKTPMIKEGVAALEEAVKDIRHVPDEEKWNTISNAA